MNSDKKYQILFTFLYFLQGVPLGLWQGTFMLILQEQGVPTNQLAILSLSSYPFAFKILTAPILDTYFFKSIGKRRSYIIPIQYLLAFSYFCLYSTQISEWIQNVPLIAGVGFFMTILAAHQDIAVDGWVLTAFTKESVHYGASCQSIGQTLGAIFSTTVFITLNSKDFCNKYIYTTEQPLGLLSLEGFCLINCVITVLITLYVQFRTIEKEEIDHHESVKVVVDHIKLLLRNKNVQHLLLHLLLFRFSFQPIVVSTSRILLTHGVKKEMIAFIQTLLIPVGFTIPVLIHKFFKQGQEMNIILKFVILRILDTILQVLLITFYPEILLTDNYTSYGLLLLFGFNTSFLSSTIFICHGSLFNRISDPKVGGTYLTFLNSFHNLGGLVIESISYLLLNYFSYEIIVVTTWLFGICYYIIGRKSILRLSSLPASEWTSGYQKLQ